MESSRDIFIQGCRHGLPIGLGYFAVAFSLGIAARDYGFSAAQGFMASLLTYASAGQYMGFALYATNATLAELALLHNPPITKSGLNHRLKKLLEEAEEL